MAIARDVVEQINNLTLGDEYLFESVLQNKMLCKAFIGTFLEIPDITDIEYVGVEETYKDSYHSKGVRFDVYVEGTDGVAYVIELQRKDTKALGKRMRYYASRADSRQLKAGKHYRELKDNIVIFIIRKPVWGGGLMRYTFRNTCVELPELELDDGTKKVAFNTKGTIANVSEDVVAFLNAIEGIETDNEFVEQFQKEAAEIKADETWRADYMQSLLREQDVFLDGKAEGHALGIYEKTIEAAKKMFTMGMDVAQIAEALSVQEGFVEQAVQSTD